MDCRKLLVTWWGILSIAILNSCTKGHPPLDVKTTLPNVIFPFKVSPDTIHISVEDTFKLYSSISSRLNDTIVLKDGNVSIGIDITRNSTDPITINEAIYAIQDSDYTLTTYGKSDARRHGDKWGLILGLNTSYNADSFSFKYDFIFLKKGVYRFGLGSNQNHLISTSGTSYPSGYFDMPDRHWSLWQVPGIDTLHRGEYGYESTYFISVN